MTDTTPAPHPRLYLGPAELDRLRATPATPFLGFSARQVVADADDFAEMPPLTYARNVHNEHLIRAREVQNRVITLLARWIQTGDARFRDAVIAHVEMMDAWEYWSWITWRPRPVSLRVPASRPTRGPTVADGATTTRA